MRVVRVCKLYFALGLYFFANRHSSYNLGLGLGFGLADKDLQHFPLKDYVHISDKKLN